MISLVLNLEMVTAGSVFSMPKSSLRHQIERTEELLANVALKQRIFEFLVVALQQPVTGQHGRTADTNQDEKK